jgi:hypothetical protein
MPGFQRPIENTTIASKSRVDCQKMDDATPPVSRLVIETRGPTSL